MAALGYGGPWLWRAVSGSHTCDKYLVTHPVLLSDVLNDVIGVTSNWRPYSIQLPYVILPRLGLLHVSYLKQKICDDFMIHPVDEN